MGRSASDTCHVGSVLDLYMCTHGVYVCNDR